jgi:hypothetical protein
MLSGKLKHLETEMQTAMDEAQARTPSKSDPEVSPLRLVPQTELGGPPNSILFSFDKTRMYVVNDTWPSATASPLFQQATAHLG